MSENKITIDQLVLANGKILIERTKDSMVFKVLKIAKNVSYEALRKKIEVNDLIICDQYMFNNRIQLDDKEYYIITAKMIGGYIS